MYFFNWSESKSENLSLTSFDIFSFNFETRVRLLSGKSLKIIFNSFVTFGFMKVISFFSISSASTTLFSFEISLIKSIWKSIKSFITSWPYWTAVNKSSSDISFDSASIIIIESEVPVITKSSVLFSNSSKVGLTTVFPSIKPSLKDAIGPFHGISEIIRAIEAPKVPKISPGFSWSLDRRFIITCVSHLNSFGNNGLIGLSVNLAERISFSDGLASLLKYPPGIFPAP